MISRVLLDVSGKVIVEENADRVLNPASLTKMMTRYLIFSTLPFSHEVVLPEDAVVKVVPGKIPQSRVGLRAGQLVTVGDLVLSMIVASGNDAAKTAAWAVKPQGFLDLMAKTARRLGLHSTNFANASGLPGGNHHSKRYGASSSAVVP